MLFLIPGVEWYATCAEQGTRTIVKPWAFRFLFVMRQLFPRQTEEAMCKRD